MADHNDLGKKGEAAAINYLKEQGYIIVETNWVFQKAEIDIIARQGNTLAIVEVKTRSTLNFGNPQDFVDPKKIKLLVKAVNAYVNQEHLDIEIRFDIIAIHKEGELFNIEHLKNAFYHF